MVAQEGYSELGPTPSCSQTHQKLVLSCSFKDYICSSDVISETCGIRFRDYIGDNLKAMKFK